MISKGLVFLAEKLLLQINFHRKFYDAIILKKQNIGRKINELVWSTDTIKEHIEFILERNVIGNTR